MRSVNARCVSIGLVLALSNCSESGGEPDAMLDMHHPGTGIDSHHPQFHNSYGNMKFIIIVINPKPSESDPPRDPKTPRSVLALALAAPLKSSNALLLAARLFFPPPVPGTGCSTLSAHRRRHAGKRVSFTEPPRELLRRGGSRNGTHVRPR